MKVLIVCLLLIHALSCVRVKHLSGPPSEFALHRVPDSSKVETIAQSSSVNLWFKPNGNLLSTTTFPQDGVDEFVLSFASPVSNTTRVELLREGNPVPPNQLKVVQGKYEVGDGADEVLSITTYLVTGCKRATYYTFNVYKDEEKFSESRFEKLLKDPRPDGVLSFVNNDGIKIHTHMQSYLLKVGSKVGLNSFIHDDNNLLTMESIHIDHANMEVIFPDGTVEDFQMKDDGLSGDLKSNDGVFGAYFQAKAPGNYIMAASVDGTFSNEKVPFQRSTQHIIAVSSATLEVKGTASMKQIDSHRVGINVDLVNTKNQPKIRAYAEVLGKNNKGEYVPACWVGGVVSINNDAIELVMDLNWLSMNGLTGPIQIENVIINDMETNFVVANYPSIINVDNSDSLIKFEFKSENVITEQMRFGVNPHPKKVKSAKRDSNEDNNIPDLLLLPGYCTDVNPFENSKSSFSKGFFPVKKGNFANDQYALHMIEEAEKASMDSFSIIGHSQGGLVATHVLNFYWSGVANATDGRLVQSVASPYQGNTAAGSTANLGNIFGIGCGSNTDLSRDGAVNWLQGISSETRKHVHFYTATYEQGRFFGDWCSLPMNLVLQWPNDGVTELVYAPLPGAVNMGNKEKWCHSTEMTHPPVCDDQERNVEMNKVAAR